MHQAYVKDLAGEKGQLKKAPGGRRPLSSRDLLLFLFGESYSENLGFLTRGKIDDGVAKGALHTALDLHASACP